MERRAFIAGITGGLLAAPLAAEAQPAGKAARVAFFGLTPIPPSLAAAFKQGLGQFGYTEGKNVVIEYRDAGGQPERLSQLAAQLNADVIFARGAGALSAAKQTNSRIPTVAVDLETDPVEMGFVRNLAQPGGNITGVFLDLPEVSGKHLQLLHEVIRPISRVAISRRSGAQRPAMSGERERRTGAWEFNLRFWRYARRKTLTRPWKQRAEGGRTPSSCSRRHSSFIAEQSSAPS